MKVSNGYFEFEVRESQMYIKLYPAVNGGAPLDVKEVMAYLEHTGYEGFNIKELNRLIVNAEEVSEFLIGNFKGYHENESMQMSLSMDKMLVVCRFYPPSNQGTLMTEAEILKDLQAQRIRIGISVEQIRKFLKNREYCKNYVFAKGIPPVHGTDARIEYFFNTDLNMRPKRNEDGSVDYRQLNTISHVEAGQRLAKLHKETLGEQGRNVYGENIPPRKVRTQKLIYANNISISEDGTQLFTDVTGHASLVNNKVFVSDVYEVPAEVDNTTGNIVYDGNVTIRGSVKSGFSVEAKGDIIVEGGVEGAVLIAGGQIIVKRGIQGMAKGRLVAKGNIITKFIENASVTAEGYIETSVILHSQVSAKTDIKVSGRKGLITGGVIRAGNIVEAVNIGSEMGAATRVEVGIEPEIKERFSFLQRETSKISKEIEQIAPILQTFKKNMGQKKAITPDKVKQIQELAAKFKEGNEQMAAMQTEMDELSERMSAATNAKVIVRGTIYPGVWVGISDIGMNVKKTYSHSKLIKENVSIVVRPL